MRDQDWMAFAHFKRCRLTGAWPDDAIVVERGVALSETERVIEMEREAMLTSAKR